MKLYAGVLTMILGAMHLLTGVVFYMDPLLEIGRNGLIAAVPDFGDLSTAFWFMMFGVLLVWVGMLARQYGAYSAELPTGFGWQMVVLGLVGGLMMPISGFWLAIPIGLLAIFGRSKPLQLQAL